LVLLGRVEVLLVPSRFSIFSSLFVKSVVGAKSKLEDGLLAFVDVGPFVVETTPEDDLAGMDTTTEILILPSLDASVGILVASAGEEGATVAVAGLVASKELWMSVQARLLRLSGFLGNCDFR
jgi:hypothetical protein